MKLETNTRTIAVGFAAALVAFGAVFWVLGVDEVLAALSRARPPVLAAVAAVAAGWLVAWGLSLRTVLGVLESPVSVVTAVAVFAAATFANNVTPFGQAGGEPFTAWLISKATERRYETGFAAIASVDALHFVPSVAFGVVGLAYFGATVALGGRLELVAAAVGVLALGLPAVAYVGWHRRYAVERRVVGVVTPVVHAVGRAFPGREPPGRPEVRRRVERFFDAVERVATDRRGLAAALGFSALGWLGLVASLWLSVYAVGYAVPIAAALIAVPVGDLAEAAPLPGGLGGVEALLVAVLAATTPVPAEVVGAAVLIHRVATYWLPMVVGGGVAAVVARD